MILVESYKHCFCESCLENYKKFNPNNGSRCTICKKIIKKYK